MPVNGIGLLDSDKEGASTALGCPNTSVTKTSNINHERKCQTEIRQKSLA